MYDTCASTFLPTYIHVSSIIYHPSYIIHHVSPIVSGQYKLALTYFQKDLDISLINQGRLDEKGRGYEIEATNSDESFLSHLSYAWMIGETHPDIADIYDTIGTL
jgi:hypothetical protein